MPQAPSLIFFPSIGYSLPPNGSLLEWLMSVGLPHEMDGKSNIALKERSQETSS